MACETHSSGAVTVAAVAAAGGVENRVSDGISGRREGCEDGVELLDETDFQDAGHDDKADYTETEDNDTAMWKKTCTEIYKQVTMATITIAHTQQSTEPPASNSHNKLYHKTQQRRHQWKNRSTQRSANDNHGAQ